MTKEIAFKSYYLHSLRQSLVTLKIISGVRMCILGAHFKNVVNNFPFPPIFETFRSEVIENIKENTNVNTVSARFFRESCKV